MSHLLLALLTSWLVGCGGKSSADDDRDRQGGGTASGGSSGGGGRAGSSGGGGRAGSSGGGGRAGSSGGTGQAGQCSDYVDDAARQVPVHIINNTSAEIHLGQQETTCDVTPLFQVADAKGRLLPHLGSCRAPCETVRQTGVPGCPDLCVLPSALTLAAGEGAITLWSTLYSVQAELPKSCLSKGAGESGSCDLARRIEPGTYTFSARAGRALDCLTTPDGGCGVCSHSGTGGCTTAGALIGGPLVSAETTLELGPAYGIGGGADGAGAAPGELNSIEIIFTD